MRSAMIVIALLALPQSAFAWGGTGHRYIGELAARGFPKEIPAFLKTPEAVRQIGLMAQEPDTSRNAGQPHDADIDPSHFLHVSDDGTILGGPRLDALPATREDFDTVLRKAGTDQYQTGFLPYEIMDGYQQLVKDFALLRAEFAAQKFAGKFRYERTVRGHIADVLAERKALTLRDLGVWAHYVGDASMPMHLSVHFLGWGDGPNPDGFVAAPILHGKFETNFVDAHVSEADVAAKMRPLHDCGCAVAELTRGYLLESWRLVVPVFQLEKQGAYDAATPEARAFVAERIAVGAGMLRDMVAMAWRESGTLMLDGSKKTTVADFEAGKADPIQMTGPGLPK